MPMLYGSIGAESGEDFRGVPDVSTSTSSFLDQSGVVPSGSSGDDTIECDFATMGAGIMNNPSVCKHENMRDEHEAFEQSNCAWNAFTTEPKQPTLKSTTSGEKNRIFSTFMSLSINPTDLNGSAMPPQFPLRLIKLEDGSRDNATDLNGSALPPQSPLRLIKLEDDSRENAISPLYKGIETLPHFFDTLPNVSFFPYLGDSAVEHYFSSTQARDDEAPMFGHSPNKAQESSKDFDIFSSMLSPLPFLEKMPAQSPLKDRSNNGMEIGTVKRQGKNLERMLQYKNKKTKVSKGAKRSLPVKKRLPRQSRFSSSDDEDYGESDGQENQSPEVKPIHAKVSRCNPLHDQKSMDVAAYSVRNIQHYNPSDDVVALLAPAKATEVTFPVIDRCKCTKSRCLKLYCDCFQAGQICTSSCDCVSCENTKNHSKPGGLRFQAIESLLLRRPDAFEHRPKKAGDGCKCKKNRCLKKYCDCFNSGYKCSSSCKCEDCKNLPDDDGSLMNQKVNKDTRRVTRHAGMAQDAKEPKFARNRGGGKKKAGQDISMDDDFLELPTPIVQAESDDNSVSESHLLFSKHDFLSAFPNDDAMHMMHFGYSSTGTPTNMEAI